MMYNWGSNGDRNYAVRAEVGKDEGVLYVSQFIDALREADLCARTFPTVVEDLRTHRVIYIGKERDYES